MIVSAQYHVSVPLIMEKLRKYGRGKDLTYSVVWFAPDHGIVIDGHHNLLLAKITKQPLRRVSECLDVCEGLTGEALLDYWDEQNEGYIFCKDLIKYIKYDIVEN